MSTNVRTLDRVVALHDRVDDVYAADAIGDTAYMLRDALHDVLDLIADRSPMSARILTVIEKAVAE